MGGIDYAAEEVVVVDGECGCVVKVVVAPASALVDEGCRQCTIGP
jgi:hypothetical protein